MFRVVERGAGKPFGAGISRLPSTRLAGRENLTPQNSTIEAQNPSRSSTDHCHNAS
jgi:hypothetical protein